MDSLSTHSPGPNTAPSNSKERLMFLILSFLNLIFLGSVVGYIYHSKFVFHRPHITEKKEREHWTKLQSTPQRTVSNPTFLSFESITLNIQPNLHGADPNPNKLHYATVGLALEINDKVPREAIEKLRPLILDHLIQLIGKKDFQELNSAQGRYLLIADLIQFTNQLNASGTSPSEPFVFNGYFSEFIVQ
jgi:flagellar basal body-associated protein FliL